MGDQVTATGGRFQRLRPRAGTRSIPTLPSQYPIAHVKGESSCLYQFHARHRPDSPGVAGARYTTDLWSRDGNVPRSTCRRHAHCERDSRAYAFAGTHPIAPYHGPGVEAGKARPQKDRAMRPSMWRDRACSLSSDAVLSAKPTVVWTRSLSRSQETYEGMSPGQSRSIGNPEFDLRQSLPVATG